MCETSVRVRKGRYDSRGACDSLHYRLLEQARGQEPCDLVLKNGRLIDVFNREIIRDDLAVSQGIILGTGPYRGRLEIDLKGRFVSPGFIDGHLHLESAMVQVGEFARRVIPLGTTTIAADPHEIANVAGLAGIKYLLQSGRGLPWNLLLMLPSCVPSTPFETSGALLQADELQELMDVENVFGLGEVMDYCGVIEGEPGLWEKILLAGERFKDGHAPGLTGQSLNSYLLAGIKADHEATTPEEAREKIARGMYIMIREGSAARDLVNLLPAVSGSNSTRFLLATDDRHPVDLLEEGHLNFLLQKAVRHGLDPLEAIRLGTINAAMALGQDRLGALAPGYLADMVVLDDLVDFPVWRVFKQGREVAREGKALFKIYGEPFKQQDGEKIFNSVRIGSLSVDRFRLPPGRRYRVMKLVPDQVITGQTIISLPGSSTQSLPVESLLDRDLVKLAVVERHHRTGNVGLGLLQGMGLREGAIATSISHDAHNIIAAGLDGEDMLLAVREIERMKGGIVVVKAGKLLAALPLPVAGLLSTETLTDVALQLTKLREAAARLGCKSDAPFMTMGFLALPVIPELKLTDRGLFDSAVEGFVPLVAG